jgi:methionyl aminopeptidase
MIYYKSQEEIELVRQSALLVSKTLAEVAKVIEEGVTGLQLDAIAETFIRDHGATPVFKGYGGFPNTLCISINEAVVHGIPHSKPFESGAIVSVDCGVKLNGFIGDSAYTFKIGAVDPETDQLLEATKKALYLGIEQAVVGNRLGDISSTIQNYVEDLGYSVVRELVGHGVGKDLHEAPEVPNYGKKGQGILLKEGLVIAVEPMINLGRRHIQHMSDGWTILTKDRKPSAHYEHTIAIGKEKVDVLSTFDYIEEALKQKNRL